MVIQSIRMALKAIVSSKTRSILTMLGIIIGVFSLVVLVSLVDGATGFVTESVSSFGKDYVEVTVKDNKGNPVTDTDLDELRKLNGINDVGVYAIQGQVTLTANGKEKTGIVYAYSSSGFKIEKQKVVYGRPLTAVDDENHIKVADIPYETAQKIFGSINVIGKTIKVNGTDYDIIGVLKKTEGTFAGMMSDNDYAVYIPYSCYSRQFSVSGYSNVVISIKPDFNPEEVKTEIKQFFYKRLNNDPDAYSLVTQEQVSTVLSGITTALAILLGGIAAISLLVGGIGIMNIMLVSVTERTREIGIRKAIGADTKSILLQFLIEAFVISLTGCLIGLFLSYGTIALINAIVKLFKIELIFHIPMNIVMVSSGFSLLVGLIFGLYPARKAAKMKPIDALRYDG